MEKSKDPEIVAKDIKYFFIQRKRGAEGSSPYYTLADQFDHHFLKAAAICISLDAYPCAYVDAHFHDKNPDQIYVGMLHQQASAKIYSNYVEHQKPNYKELLDEYIRILKRQVKLGRKVSWILNCDHLMFAAWFRICATKEPDNEIIAKYKEAAQSEMNLELIEFLRLQKLDYKRITL